MSALDVLVKAKLADLVTVSEEGTSVEEIADKVGMHADKLVRVMRALTAMDVFTEVKERRFRLTAIGKHLQSTAIFYPFSRQWYYPFTIFL